MTSAATVQQLQPSQTAHQIGEPVNPYRLSNNFHIPDWLADRPISLGAKAIYGALTRFAGKDGRCFPKLETVGKAWNMKKSTVQKYITELRECGLIQVIRRGLGRSNEYIFLAHEWMKGRLRGDATVSEHSGNRFPSVVETPTIIEETDGKETTAQPAGEPEPVPALQSEDTQLSSLSSEAEIKTLPNMVPLDITPAATEPVRKPESIPELRSEDAQLSLFSSEEPEIRALLDMIPPDAIKTPALEEIIIKGVKKHGADRVQRNIEYANRFNRDRRKYRAYLARAVKGDWAQGWKQEQAEIARQEAEKAQAEKKRLEEAARQEEEKKKQIELENQEFEEKKAQILNHPDRAVLEAEFVAQAVPMIVNLYQKKGLASETVLRAFIRFAEAENAPESAESAASETKNRSAGERQAAVIDMIRMIGKEIT